MRRNSLTTSGGAAALRGAWRAPGSIRDKALALVTSVGIAGKNRSDTGRAALFAFAIRVASAAIAYLSQVLLARWMGGFEYGVFVFVWVWVLILGGSAPLGFSVTATRYVAEYRAKRSWPLLRGLLARSRLIAVGCSTLFMLLGLGTLTQLGEAVASYFILPAFLILFCLPAYTLVDIQDGIARGFGWIDVALIAPYITRPLLILLGMAGVYLAGFPMTAVTAAGAAIVACWVAALMQTFTLETRMRCVLKRGRRATATRLWLLTSAPLLLMHGFELLLQNTDILVLSRYVSPDQVAIYFAGLKTIGLVAFVHFAVGTASAHRFSSLKAKGHRSELAAFVRQSVRWTFWPTLLGALVLLALGKPLLWLFGPEFTQGYSVMFLLALGFLIRAAVGPAEYILTMLGQQKICAIALCMSAALNLALNFALIPTMGLHGAALATAISIAASSALMVWAVKTRLGLNILVGT